MPECEEKWEWVPGYERLYEVSDRGRVRSVRRPGSAGGLLKVMSEKRHGYLVVNLSRGGHKTKRPVHGLVMEAFVGPRPAGMETRHLDGNPSNGRLENLAYGTVRENQLDRRAHGTDLASRRPRCPAGHEYTPENTYRPPSAVGRRCRICANAKSLARYHSRKTGSRVTPG